MFPVMERALCASPEQGEGVNSSLWWVLLPESSQPTVTVKGRTDTVLAAHTQRALVIDRERGRRQKQKRKRGWGGKKAGSLRGFKHLPWNILLFFFL